MDIPNLEQDFLDDFKDCLDLQHLQNIERNSDDSHFEEDLSDDVEDDLDLSQLHQDISEEKLRLPTGSQGHLRCSYKVSVERLNKKEGKSKKRWGKNRQDKPTVDHITNYHTEQVLSRLLERKVISRINECVSTRKGADMYHALSENGVDYIVKIYKSSILSLKDWDKYGMKKSQVRHRDFQRDSLKILTIWAKREKDNLSMMQSIGLNVPRPLLSESNVMVMSFIGNDGQLAPRLKDVKLSQSEANKIYRDTVKLMWKMYNICNLVLADLSEFNLHYHDGEIYVFDMTQSVGHDHPEALEFLRNYCDNITKYFKKHYVATMMLRELFHFVTDSSKNESNMEECLRLSDDAAHNTATS